MTSKKTRQGHLTSFASSPVTAAAPMRAQLSTPFPFSSLNLRGYSAICGALSPSLPLTPIRPVIRYDVRRSRMARSAHSLTPSAFLESHAVSPSRREGGRREGGRIPLKFRQGCVSLICHFPAVSESEAFFTTGALVESSSIFIPLRLSVPLSGPLPQVRGCHTRIH